MIGLLRLCCNPKRCKCVVECRTDDKTIWQTKGFPMNNLAQRPQTAPEGRMYTADDYDYNLPDHWILDQSNIWTIMHHAYVARVVDLVRESGAKKVVEVGCGDGWNCGQLAEAGFNVVGVDWSKNGVDHAKRLVPGAEFFCGDVKSPEFREQFKDPFDACIFVEVLEHIPPDECVEAMRNVRDLVRPGGRIVLTTPSTNFPNTNPSHYRHFTQKVLEDLVSETGGLKIEKIEGYGDVEAERRHWARARWVRNRYYTLHPALKRLNHQYSTQCSGTPPERCRGFILTMERV